MSSPTAQLVRRRAVTTAVVAFSLFCSLLTVSITEASGTIPTWNSMIGFLLNVGAGIALVWRREKPWLVFGLSLLGPAFFATDATAAMFALYAVSRTARPRELTASAAAAFVVAGVSLTYDAHRTRDNSVLTIGTLRPKDGSPVPDYDVAVWVPWLGAAVLVALVVGVAMLRRTRSDLSDAVTTRDKVTEQSNALREQMLIDAERSRIARDMHDTLAATLSRISLFAGGLQVNSADGPEKVSNTASLIRQTAHDGLDELKRIIGVLRGTSDHVQGRQSLEGIADLVHSARTAGMHAILVFDVAPGQPGALSSHVSYRVAQESLTNAQKHAQQSPIHLSVSGTETSGIRIDVRNHLISAPVFGHGSSTGLQGLAEQVRTVGGTFAAGPRGGEFHVSAWLPWFT